MQKVRLHKALLVGMSIHILCLSLGIFFAVKKTSKHRAAPTGIISELTLADDIYRDSDDSKSKKRFGFGFAAEEDDDDSANNFYHSRIEPVEFHNFILVELTTAHLANPRNIPTPPPWC